jgi:hypothetical protein
MAHPLDSALAMKLEGIHLRVQSRRREARAAAVSRVALIVMLVLTVGLWLGVSGPRQDISDAIRQTPPPAHASTTVAPDLPAPSSAVVTLPPQTTTTHKVTGTTPTTAPTQSTPPTTAPSPTAPGPVNHALEPIQQLLDPVVTPVTSLVNSITHLVEG